MSFLRSYFKAKRRDAVARAILPTLWSHDLALTGSFDATDMRVMPDVLSAVAYQIAGRHENQTQTPAKQARSRCAGRQSNAMMTHSEAKRRIAAYVYTLDGYDSLLVDKQKICDVMADWHLARMAEQRIALQTALYGIEASIRLSRAEYLEAGARAVIVAVNKAML